MPILALVYVLSAFLSALLLFWVQPMAAKMLLPAFGGSPSVWNTALVFFQLLLVGGYLYAHLLTRHAQGWKQGLVHLPVLLLPLAALPHAALGGASPAVGATPQLKLLLALTLMVGAPYFALSTNASLVQYWWSQREKGRDPYWLYAASNAGSLLALLAYGLVLEPTLSLPHQTHIWNGLYVVFVACTMAALILAARIPPSTPQAPSEGRAKSRPLSGKRKSVWALRAAVATSLLMALTLQISTDLAPAPLFWVVPLALYLLSFIIAFGAADRLPRRPLQHATLVALLAAAGMLVVQGHHPYWLVMPVCLGALFSGALLCHRDLAADRPDPQHLTSFYLWISLGGAVGGLLNGLVAPLVFDTVAELPLTLILLSGLLYLGLGEEKRLSDYRPTWWVGGAAALVFALPAALALGQTALPEILLLLAALTAVVWVVCARRFAGLAGLSAALPCLLLLAGDRGEGLLAQERSFFGVVRVRDTGSAIEMAHGNTLHGRQLKDRPGIPLTYYYTEGPLGSAVKSTKPGGRIGVVGLGSGSLAALNRPDQHMVFYEIDPLVEELARAHFRFLAEAPGEVRVRIGDGRLALAEEGTPFDLLVVDAFSSDFVPTHLLTDEALDLFLRRLSPDGRLVFHITNRHADLRRVLQGYARARDVPLLLAEYSPSPQAAALGASATTAAALALGPAPLEDLARSGLWRPMPPSIPAVRWTDSHAGLLGVLY